MSPQNPNEAITRKELIDPALARAGWDISNPQQVRFEIPVDGTSAEQWQTVQAELRRLKEQGIPYSSEELPSGICDYVLYGANGTIVAIIEAKRTSKDVRLAEAQADFYVKEIEKQQGYKPIAFLSNGNNHYVIEPGSTRREVAGIFSLEEIETRHWLRENRMELGTLPINASIAGRPYQQEAIRRVGEAFDGGKRRALLVMATGTGKTRTAMAITDLMIRANQARRILFVADRDALVEQALKKGFKKFLPNEPAIRLRGGTSETDKNSKRLFVATLQTLSSIYTQLSPGFFDVIIFDEVHRSIFNKWNEVLQYFDARMIGLTATPAGFIERNTFIEFDCSDNVPTFVYSYQDAVREKYLVDYTPYKARTHFQREGIVGALLNEEQRNHLLELGIDPDEVNYAGTDLEKKVTNRDTLRKQWEEVLEVCYKDQAGHYPGKTIVFASSQDHALRLADVFNEMYPQYAGMAKVITSESDFKGTDLADFDEKEQPRIAISVDMLDTGVDIPEVVNLVFMRPVHSQIKIQQMIGRGTRNHEACLDRPHLLHLLPNGHKDGFLIIDFWENEFNRQSSGEPPNSLPVLVGLFNTRLTQLERVLGQPQSPLYQRMSAKLREMVMWIPRDTYSVQKVWYDVAPAWEDDFWNALTKPKVDFLRLRVAPLLRFAAGTDIAAQTFTHKVERLKLRRMERKTIQQNLKEIFEDVALLPDLRQESPQAADWVDFARDLARLESATLDELDEMMDTLAPFMNRRRNIPLRPVEIDLLDRVAEQGYLIFPDRKEPLHVQEYKQIIEDKVLEMVMAHPTLQALDAGQPVTDAQLLDLERTLRRDLGAPLKLDEALLNSLYRHPVDSFLAFVRHIWGVAALPDYTDIVQRSMETFITNHQPPFNATQILFIRTLSSTLAQRRRVNLADLYDAPFTQWGADAIEKRFSDSEIDELIQFAETLAIDNG